MIGYSWLLREVMASCGIVAATEIVPLLRERGIELSASQVHRLVSGTPERLSLRVLSAFCDILGCTRRECDRAAALTGERNDFWTAFGPANVAIHRVWLATEMGDPLDALRLAAHVDDTALPPELAERRASQLITVAWSHYLRRHDDDALSALVAARAAAPEKLMLTHRVHDMLRQMLRRDRRRRRGLRELAEFVGVR